MGSSMVRRLPVVRLLLSPACPVRRGALGRVPLCGCLQARHCPRPGHFPGVGLGLRAVGGLQEACARVDGRGNLAVLVQYLLHHLWREHSLDARRRVLVLSRAHERIALPRRVRVRAPDRPAALAGGGPVRGDAAVPRRPGTRLRGHRDPARAEPLEQEHLARACSGRRGRCIARGVLARSVRR